MNKKSTLPIIKQTEKAFTLLPKAESKRKKPKRAELPKYDLSEKAFAKQIDDIIRGEK